ncbi:MAG: aminoacetone oxidase family FAD-binding enzyme [Aquimarina sp.]|nr:aminoacetone oxidase family FAD-binding enzyme [Aquimarina sp.]
MNYDLIIVGGGAAGFFMAINVAEKKPDYRIVILERGKEVLSKVRVSGGGRCNVTHAEFIPKELSKNYPRGKKELLGPFHSFMTGDTIEWFSNRGVELKIEEDGRMFPVTDSSSTIIDCFLQQTKRYNIEVMTSQAVKNFYYQDENWYVETNKTHFQCAKLAITTGSNVKIWDILSAIGHKIIAPVPSLFTFNIEDYRIKDLPGLSSNASVKVLNSKLQSEGPVLVTHWGLSGPAILKLSAWGAIVLESFKYKFDISVNWLSGYNQQEVFEELLELKEKKAKQLVAKYAQFDLPKRLWRSLVSAAHINEAKKWADVSNKELHTLSEQLTHCIFKVDGKSTFKEEFVTAGGVDLKEINFKTYESRVCPNLFLAGEVINVDAITGGFNFQNAWTGAFIAAQKITEE